jgi:L-ribulose-5-phosphate 4-epimerase
MILGALRAEITRLNKQLASTGLVRWTSGNVSGRDSETGHVVIKPSGVPFEELTPEMMVVLDAEGQKVDGYLNPSVDSISHMYIYQNRADIGGIVHTHSKYATAFAVAGLELPVTTTTHACLFGCAVPVSSLAEIGEEQIGIAVVNEIGEASAILMRNHGVFALGPDAGNALKNAVYVEESAEATFLGKMLNSSLATLDDSFVDDCRKMYINDYGQNNDS